MCLYNDYKLLMSYFSLRLFAHTYLALKSYALLVSVHKSWIIVAAKPLRWKLSENLCFHRRVCIFYWRAFSFHRRKSTIYMIFFQMCI